MAAITLPDVLGYGMVAGYALTPDDQTVRTEIEAGAPRVRRRFTSGFTRATLAWTWSATQFSVFEYWWANVASGGAAWFNAPVENGQGVNACEVRFTKPWRAELLGAGVWRVSAETEIRARPLMTRSAWDTATGSYVATDYVATDYYTP